MSESNTVSGQPADAAERAAVQHPHPAHLAHHFDDVEQQREAATLGMWTFLATEVLFFGALIGAYLIYRSIRPIPSVCRGASHLSVPLAAQHRSCCCAAVSRWRWRSTPRRGPARGVVGLLLLTIVLGAVFLGIKATEYYLEYQEDLVPLAGFRFAFEGADPQQGQAVLRLLLRPDGLHACI